VLGEQLAVARVIADDRPLRVDQVAVAALGVLHREESEALVHLERLLARGVAQQPTGPFLGPPLARRVIGRAEAPVSRRPPSGRRSPAPPAGGSPRSPGPWSPPAGPQRPRGAPRPTCRGRAGGGTPVPGAPRPRRPPGRPPRSARHRGPGSCEAASCSDYA